eukprot:GHVL01024909.1.p1 GENE.GHVL01024909.1~~GHVL01024909.1.p1  ORF type:complete len:206 (+),score=26.57 GHVL01024909.1:53-670(+)
MESVLSLDPTNVIEFRTDNEKVATSCLKIINITKDVVWFKIKTTAPKDYVVKPSTGRLEPKGETKISITLQEMPNRRDDRFLVQALRMEDAKREYDLVSSEQLPKEGWTSPKLKEYILDHKLSVKLDGQITRPDVPSQDNYQKRRFDELLKYCVDLEHRNQALREDISKAPSTSWAIRIKWIMCLAFFVIGLFSDQIMSLVLDQN